jgi:hypothetical protein
MHKHPHWLPQLIVKADTYNNAAVHLLEKLLRNGNRRVGDRRGLGVVAVEL